MPALRLIISQNDQRKLSQVSIVLKDKCEVLTCRLGKQLHPGFTNTFKALTNLPEMRYCSAMIDMRPPQARQRS